jgi:hypothetical protein
MKRFFYLLAIFLIAATTVFAQNTSNEKLITKADLDKIGSSIPAASIGEPVGSVKLYAPRWIEAVGETAAYGVVEGSIMPVDPNGWPINFRVLLPSKWSYRTIQQGGGGMNGSITVREGRNPMLAKGFVLYGSDSGHQAGGMFGSGGSTLASGPANAGPNDWSLNDEAIKNLGYMQMKKTHDAAMFIIEKVYGARPKYNYYIGGSQGGREGQMVAQRYPKDYNGILSDVPIVGFSTLMLAPELIRIQEKPAASWVTPAKVNAIRNEFLRQCDKLDGLADGIINNYLAAREIFNVTDGVGPKDPWAALRGPDGKDPNPDDKSVSAKLTDGQIKTLEFTYSQYKFPEPFASGTKSFGMWLPTITPDDFGTIAPTRFKGQEGAPENAQVHGSLGSLGVTGFMMKDPKANPLDYPGDDKLLARRKELSAWLDATNPDLTEFYKNGGKMIVTVGTMDFIASSGAQIDYYQSLLDKMGRSTLDKFARLYVVPHGGHGLSGRGYKTNGEGQDVTVKNIPAPNSSDKTDMLIAWVEEGKAPAKTLIVGADGKISVNPDVKGYLLCSYPEYPKYKGGPEDMVSSYVSAGK